MRKVKNLFVLAIIPLMSYGGGEQFSEAVLSIVFNYMKNAEDVNRFGLCDTQLQSVSGQILKQTRFLAEYNLKALSRIEQYYQNLRGDETELNPYETELNRFLNVITSFSRCTISIEYRINNGEDISLSQWLEKLKSGNASYIYYCTHLGHSNLEVKKDTLAFLIKEYSDMEEMRNGFEDNFFEYSGRDKYFKQLNKFIGDFKQAVGILAWTLDQVDQLLNDDSESKT